MILTTAERLFADPDRLDFTGLPARMGLQVVHSTLYRRIPTDLDRIPFKQDGSAYGVHELLVAWRLLSTADPTRAAPGRARHTALQPSSTGSTAPLMCRAASEARKTSAAACSSGKAIRSETTSPGPITPGPWARASTS